MRKKNAKPMSKGMRSRCQGECEADVKSNAKPMSRRARSRCQEGAHTRTRARRREVQTHTNKLTPSKGTIRCKVFGVIFNSYLNDFGGHIGMILLLLRIEFWDIFQIMLSLCQEECEADVNIILWSRYPYNCEADVKTAITGRQLHVQTSMDNGRTHTQTHWR